MPELPPIESVPPWPGGYSSYPHTEDIYPTGREDLPTIKDINDLAAAIIAIEGIIGPDPAGIHPTIKQALSTFEVALSGLSTSQSSLADEVAILSAIPGPPNTYYRFIQGTPLTQWVISHPLGRYPAVTVTDSAGTVVEGEVTYPTPSRVIIDFSSPFSGEAYLT